MLYAAVYLLSAGADAVVGVHPALAVVWIRVYVKEPEVWLENKRQQVEQKAEVKVSVGGAVPQRYVVQHHHLLLVAHERVLTVYYSIFGLFATYMTKELRGCRGGPVGWPLAFSNGVTFIFSFLWGTMADKIGRRWAMIIPAVIGAAVLPPMYLLTDGLHVDRGGGSSLQGVARRRRSMHGPVPELSRPSAFRPRSRATASGFLLSPGGDLGRAGRPAARRVRNQPPIPLSGPILITTVVCLVIFVIAVYLGPETKGKELVADLVVA